jgi:hypothetical protein
MPRELATSIESEGKFKSSGREYPLHSCLRRLAPFDTLIYL